MKCKYFCAYLPQMQQHMLEDHCCKYCDQTSASRTEKKYMCKLCEITFSPGVQLHIHTKKTCYMENATAKVTKPVPAPRSEKSKPPPCSVPQALQYKCTECSHQGEKEDEVVKHIKQTKKGHFKSSKVYKISSSP